MMKYHEMLIAYHMKYMSEDIILVSYERVISVDAIFYWERFQFWCELNGTYIIDIRSNIIDIRS